VADGTYSNPTPVDFPQPNGSGLVALVGNTTNPSAVLILNSGSGSCWRASAGGNFSVNGFSFQATAASSGDLGSALWWTSGSSLSLYACSFGAVPGYHILVGPSASCLVFGPCTITGSALAHQYGYENGTLLNATPNNPTLNIPNAVTFSNGFVIASNGGQTRPIWSGITGAGNVTGAKYIGTSNGVIDTNGRGASYLPGTIAGSLATGGQYL
jgi:hypothetical protein